MSIQFIIDSASDIPWDYAKKNKIKVVSLKVNYYETVFSEDENFDLKEYYNNFKVNENFLPKTSQPSPADYVQAYQQLVKDGAKEIIVITISSGLSGTYNSARLAKENFKLINPSIPIYLVDSLNASYSEVFILEEGLDLMEKGLSAKDIAQKLSDYTSKVKTHIFLQSLKYLHLGGRISLTKYLLGKLLRKQALVRVNPQGKNESFGTVKTTQEGLEALIKATTQNNTITPRKVCIVHTNNPELAKILEKKVKEAMPKSDIRTVLSRTSISAHTGPFGISLIADFG